MKIQINQFQELFIDTYLSFQLNKRKIYTFQFYLMMGVKVDNTQFVEFYLNKTQSTVSIHIYNLNNMPRFLTVNARNQFVFVMINLTKEEVQKIADDNQKVYLRHDKQKD